MVSLGNIVKASKDVLSFKNGGRNEPVKYHGDGQQVYLPQQSALGLKDRNTEVLAVQAEQHARYSSHSRLLVAPVCIFENPLKSTSAVELFDQSTSSAITLSFPSCEHRV
jgi:hypothetical protein